MGGMFDLGTGSLTVLQAANGGSIGLGDTAGDLTLSDAELNNITAASLTVGNGTGSIMVDNVTSGPAATLNGSGVTFQNNDSTFESLSVTGATTIDGVDLNTTAGAMMFNSPVTLSTGPVILTTVGGNLTFGGTLNGAQVLTLNPGGTAFFNGNVGGTTPLTSLTLNGTGEFNASSMAATGLVNLNGAFTTAGAFNLTASDLDLGGAFSTGANAFNVTVAGNGAIGLGTGALAFQLTDAELDNITTSLLSIASGGAATLDNVSFGHSLQLVAADFTILNPVSVGTNTLTLRGLAGSSIGLGSSTGDMTLDSTELGRITAGTLNIGDSSAGALTLNSVTLSAANITQSFGAFTGGALTVTGAFVSPVATTLSTTGAGESIVLNHAGHVFGGTLNLFTGTGGGATITGFNNGGQALTLGTLGLDGSLTVNLPVALNLTGVVTAAGDVSLINTGGGIAFTNGASLNAGNGRITVRTPGNLTLGQIATGSGSLSAIMLTVGGAVIDGGDIGGEDIIAPGGGLVVQTGTGFGTVANPIEVRIGSLSLHNTQSGEVALVETDSLNVLSLIQDGTGGVFISFSGEITGRDNITLKLGEPDILNRATGFTFSKLLGNTGKQRDELALERTVNNITDINYQWGPNRHDWSPNDATPGGALRRSMNNGSRFGEDLFGDPFPLVELEGQDPDNRELNRLENWWNGEGRKRSGKVSQEPDRIDGEEDKNKPEKKEDRRGRKKEKDSGVLNFFKNLF